MHPDDTIAVRRFADGAEAPDPDHYSLVWMKSGVRSVTIDFQQFAGQPHAVFFVAPGQTLRLECNPDPVGWMISFPHSVFVDVTRADLVIKDAGLFSLIKQVPRIILSPKISERICSIAEMIDELSGSQIPGKEAAVVALLRTLLIYCDSRCNIRIDRDNSRGKIQIVTEFKALVASHFTHSHKVKDYADKMNITPKYLNQVVREVLGVTAKTVIQEQLTIQARRELKFSNDSVKEIAFRLGFTEPFHFSSYFKKQMGYSPSEYRTL